MPTFRFDTKLGTCVPLIKTSDLNDKSVTKAKLADEVINTMGQNIASISKEKIDELFKNSDIIILPR